MKPMMLIGIALIILGAIAFAYHGITYTTREKVLQIGPLEATKKNREDHPIATHLGWSCACRWDCIDHHRC